MPQALETEVYAILLRFDVIARDPKSSPRASPTESAPSPSPLFWPCFLSVEILMKDKRKITVVADRGEVCIRFFESLEYFY